MDLSKLVEIYSRKNAPKHKGELDHFRGLSTLRESCVRGQWAGYDRAVVWRLREVEQTDRHRDKEIEKAQAILLPGL